MVWLTWGKVGPVACCLCSCSIHSELMPCLLLFIECSYTSMLFVSFLIIIWFFVLCVVQISVNNRIFTLSKGSGLYGMWWWIVGWVLNSLWFLVMWGGPHALWHIVTSMRCAWSARLLSRFCILYGCIWFASFCLCIMVQPLLNTTVSLGRGWEVTSLLLVPCWCQKERNMKFADMMRRKFVSLVFLHVLEACMFKFLPFLLQAWRFHYGECVCWSTVHDEVIVILVKWL
jgi:hypothetical protein